jgi:hypothetical protein
MNDQKQEIPSFKGVGLMFKNRAQCAILLCLLVLFAGCSYTVENSVETAGAPTPAISDTAPTQSTVTEGSLEATPLTAEEVEQYNKAFEQILSDGEGNQSVNPLCHFFTSNYDRPEDINLVKFLWYFPWETNVTDEAEFEALRAHESWPFGDAPDGIPVPIHRIPAAAVNDALKKYAGITLDELSGVGTEKLIYLKQYDAYYTYTSDFGPGFFVCTRGERQGDIIRLYGDSATLTLELKEDGYLIVSYQKTGEDQTAKVD